ncbi:MAG: ImmA/IrrE family metallo-endopeptidase [Planctomycetales bacterium]|nr:ImmA/IrrE family metallo-endopeptidase [Planctomycetales bacterium]
MRRKPELHKHIQYIVNEMEVSDPREAIRKKARIRLEEFLPLFDSVPFDLVALASCFGLHWSDEAPAYSEDSELVPDADGRVSLRVNQHRPITRQRFSIAHEIGHTLFPEYQYSVRCRKANERRWTDDDLIESLCDVAASEFLFPLNWFQNAMTEMEWSGDGLATLADDFQASREATARRFVELHEAPMAAVYFSWKLKPIEEKDLKRNQLQGVFFEDLRPEDPTPKLRVDYAILSDSYRALNFTHIPAHKSIPSEGPVHAASLSQLPTTGKCLLQFGRSEEEFEVIAAPIYTPEEDTGPNNASSVVAIIRPANHARKPR